MDLGEPMYGSRMLESPVNRNPARCPRLNLKLFGPLRMLERIEDVEILPREDVPVALHVNLLHLRGQRIQLRPVGLREMWIVRCQRRHKCKLVLQGPQLNGKVSVNPQLLHPCVTYSDKIRAS